MEKKNFNPITLILTVLLIVAAFLGGTMWMKNQNLQQKEANGEQVEGKIGGAQIVQPTQEPLKTTIGGFVSTGDEVCQQDGKPLIYYFGYKGCPHCTWNHPIMEKVAKKFPNEIVFHDNMDKLDQDQDIQGKYAQISQGAVPFFLFGCQYARLGSGENYGEAEEEKFLTALICKLTEGQPEKICTPVKDLIDQIK